MENKNKPLTINHKPFTALRVAVGHDDLTVPYAGGEKVFAAIAEAFPKADIFTSMITDLWRERLEVRGSKSERKFITTFMQKLPLKRKLQKALFCLYPLAFESLDFSDYDLVISSSSRFAHGVITRPETKHVCYMHSPGRMFWEPGKYFVGSPDLGKFLSPALSYLRLWDHAAAQRVDQFIANSKNIASKIKRYYGRDSAVVYPFVDLEKFKLGVISRESGVGDYYLVVTRLAPWKRVEIAVEAAKIANVPLKIVGSGPDRKRLERLKFGPTSHKASRGEKVEFLGGVGDGELVNLYQNCTALIMTQEEDFGITALEAQACGKPVIAYGAGGALETVIAGKTGEFFPEQTAESLTDVLRKFNAQKYSSKDCRANAEKFSKERFQWELLKVVENELKRK